MHFCTYHKLEEPEEGFRTKSNGKLDSWCVEGRREYNRANSKRLYAPVKAEVAKAKEAKAAAETKTCTACGLEKDIEEFGFRPDRPGKRWAKCIPCQVEYQRKKTKETYYRYQEDYIVRSQKYRDEHPNAAKEAYALWVSDPDNHEKKKSYMRIYNAPYRIHVKGFCEADGCDYVSRSDDHRDMDVHHRDGNHDNNDPSNLQTLCVLCHRLLGRV
jgi:hypothetical protein